MTDHELGGEAPCWAHLIDDLDGDSPTPGVVVVDLSTLVDVDRAADDPSGAVWSLPHGGDLDANLVHLHAGDAIARHVNDAVDVLLVVWAGEGEIEVDGETTRLAAGVVVLVRQGARRSITAASASSVTYLSIHRRRDGLTIGRRT